MTIQYRMSAASIEAKGEAKGADKGAAKTDKAEKPKK